MDALKALYTRMSAWRLNEPAPSAAVIQTCLQAAITAPDHGKMRPWRFLIIEGEGRNRLGNLMADALKVRQPDVTESVLAREREKPLRAPLIIVTAARILPDAKIPVREQRHAVAAATQNILLALHAQSFGGLWTTGAAAYDRVVKEGLGFATDDEIIGFLYIGTSGAPAADRPIGDPSEYTRHWN